MSYDTERHCVVLFGGTQSRQANYEDALFGDTWERRDGIWKEENNFGPGPCEYAAMVFDGFASILFWGYVQGGGPKPTRFNSGATWEWNGRLWTQKQDMGAPARDAPAMAFDSDRRQIVLFGGFAVKSMFGDTWELLRE